MAQMGVPHRKRFGSGSEGARGKRNRENPLPDNERGWVSSCDREREKRRGLYTRHARAISSILSCMHACVHAQQAAETECTAVSLDAGPKSSVLFGRRTCEKDGGANTLALQIDRSTHIIALINYLEGEFRGDFVIGHHGRSTSLDGLRRMNDDGPPG